MDTYNLNDARDQALLNALAKQAIRVPVPMVFVAFIISGLAYERVPLLIIVVWASMTIGMQVIRFIIIRGLAKETGVPARDRLKTAAHLSLANGLVLASSIMFFTSLDETSRAIYSMIMMGIVGGTIATSHGYRPVFIGLVLPILTAVAFAWLLTAADTLSFIQTLAISVLTTALGILLYVSSRDVYASFSDSFTVRQELEAALDSERSANAAKTRFLAAASHDLRQPLHVMSMLSAALTIQDLDERSKMIAEKMNSAMTDLSSELDSLLDISKLDAGVMRVRPSYFDVTSSLVRTVSNYKELSKRKNIELSLSADEPVYVDIDKALFERVIRNLLDNAIKYTDSGSVTVRVKNSNKRCYVYIEDTGIGIPKDEQLKVKEEFYQLNNPERDRQKGLGLGLSIVWRLIPLIDGALTMESETGKGTKYVLTLSANTDRSNGALFKQKLSDNSNLNTQVDLLKGTSVLLVEDDKEVRLGTRTLLESCGLVVHEATSTVESVLIAERETIDIALIDLRLPEQDSGFITIESLRSCQQAIPIIILSGETSPDILQQAALAQCEFMVKPVDMKELIEEIYAALHTE